MPPILAKTDQQIQACHPVMRELRPHVAEADFLSRVHALQPAGYQLVYIEENGTPIAAAGFRVIDNLAWGRFLYVDDLVTASAHRSQGHGKALLDWLKHYARDNNCGRLHLDSGFQRVDAHRFYDREGIERLGIHFGSEIR